MTKNHRSSTIRHAVDVGNRRFGLVWLFETARFRVELRLARDSDYVYDGDDENGETQAKLDSGEYVAFDSTVTVYLDEEEIGSDHLGSSVYSYEEVQNFYRDHWQSEAKGRNCAENNYRIGHYFPQLVKDAIAEARETLSARKPLPRLRAA